MSKTRKNHPAEVDPLDTLDARDELELFGPSGMRDEVRSALAQVGFTPGLESAYEILRAEIEKPLRMQAERRLRWTKRPAAVELRREYEEKLREGLKVEAAVNDIAIAHAVKARTVYKWLRALGIRRNLVPSR